MSKRKRGSDATGKAKKAKSVVKGTLGYWAIRGLAQPVRLLLAYSGIEYEDKRYVCSEGPKFDRSQWTNEKHKLGLEFPNLPYWIQGDLKLTQSQAIVHHVAREADLMADDATTQSQIEMLEGAIFDLRNEFVDMCYADEKHHKEKLEEYKKAAPEKLKEFNSWLHDKKRKWVAGDKLTYVDFYMYELLDQNRILQPNIFEAYPALAAHIQQFEALPKIAEYRKSPLYIERPLNNPQAQFK